MAGPIDILVGNAGVNRHFGPTSTISDDDFEATLAANVQANLWLAQLVAPDMQSRGGGSMMFTSSIAAFRASPVLGTYGISKLALIGLVKNLAPGVRPARHSCQRHLPRNRQNRLLESVVGLTRSGSRGHLRDAAGPPR